MELKSLKEEDHITLDDYGTITAAGQQDAVSLSPSGDDTTRILTDDQLAVSLVFYSEPRSLSVDRLRLCLSICRSNVVLKAWPWPPCVSNPNFYGTESCTQQPGATTCWERKIDVINC